MEKMKASGKIEIITLTDAEKATWRKALLPVHKEAEGRVGKEMIDAFHHEAEAAGYQ